MKVAEEILLHAKQDESSLRVTIGMYGFCVFSLDLGRNSASFDWRARRRRCRRGRVRHVDGLAGTNSEAGAKATNKILPLASGRAAHNWGARFVYRHF